ncbi:hypothetical protein SK571_36795 [Lentzea sp. BCCO 10_0798]|uniref:Uncharacterized protein n=1 Tax=Lentzea kristufekii TaxID=3095430 RepID=A0ABU4U4N4_9PSEU|nr:hypothetical protein [Lentzea sp. BCCO 10_0798]MDX8054961.1 hypothetical protein [Lentzea sp. BCCO 10_0798]
MTTLTPAVAEAVAAVRAHFADHSVEVTADGAGGAIVVIDNVDFGSRYTPQTTWLGFQIDAACPHSDIYPFYCGRVARTDGGAHGEGVQTMEWRARPALQLSRRSNRRNGLDNAVLKAERVITWFATR